MSDDIKEGRAGGWGLMQAEQTGIGSQRLLLASRRSRSQVDGKLLVGSAGTQPTLTPDLPAFHLGLLNSWIGLKAFQMLRRVKCF